MHSWMSLKEFQSWSAWNWVHPIKRKMHFLCNSHNLLLLTHSDTSQQLLWKNNFIFILTWLCFCSTEIVVNWWEKHNSMNLPESACVSVNTYNSDYLKGILLTISGVIWMLTCNHVTLQCQLLGNMRIPWRWGITISLVCTVWYLWKSKYFFTLLF